MIVTVTPKGELKAIYSDGFNWRALGRPIIQRASQVEPDGLGLWYADLSLSGGPRIGPFVHRADAISAEMGWLEKYRL